MKMRGPIIKGNRWITAAILLVLLNFVQISYSMVGKKLFEDKCATCEESIEELRFKMVTMETLINELNQKVQNLERDTCIDHGMLNPLAGPPGPKGDKGENGLKGERGVNGIGGPQGERGLKGESGLNGSPGTGTRGLQGPPGERGLKGERGLNGSPGIGMKGERGLNGSPGIGMKGERGLNGSPGIGLQGPQGERGLKGDRGTDGTKGQQGATGTTSTDNRQLVEELNGIKMKTNYMEKHQRFPAIVSSATVYSEKYFQGKSDNYNVDPKHYGVGCYNFPGFTHPIKSINTHDSCVRVFAEKDCIGTTFAVFPGSINHEDVQVEMSKPIQSIGPCFEVPHKNRFAGQLQEAINKHTKETVPIGFIYIQFGNQLPPTSLWPNASWTDVTTQYAGQFFRALGGSSGSFGSTQQENAPKLTKVEWTDDDDCANRVTMNTGMTNACVRNGRYVWEFSGQRSDDYTGFHFTMSGGEVRPYNSPIKIFKRTS